MDFEIGTIVYGNETLDFYITRIRKKQWGFIPLRG
jgi:hypothetical protein